MTRDDAILYADTAASTVFSAAGKLKGRPSWRVDLSPTAHGMAEFLDASQGAPVEALYLYAGSRAGEDAIPCWTAIAREKRVAFEVFRATYLVLMALVKADAETDPKPSAEQGHAPGAFGPMTFDATTGGLESKVKF